MSRTNFGSFQLPRQKSNHSPRQSAARHSEAASIPASGRDGFMRPSQAACACGGKCPKCRDASGAAANPVPDTVRSSGQPLDPATRSEMSRRFNRDLSPVRVHTGTSAAVSARELDALAYTVGRHIAFGAGMYRPRSGEGQRLLAHELAHVLQQGGERTSETGLSKTGPPVAEQNGAEREADAAAGGVLDARPIRVSHRASLAGSVQRQTFHTPSVSVRSPVLEETVTQLTELMPGRFLTRRERELAGSVFGTSIDYSRVRLIPTSVLEYRTVANSIRVPENFTIANAEMAQTLIHEMTHVWQYQHSGTSYLSISLGTQIAAQVGRGNRNFAYDYRIQAGRTFFDFTPEQQAFMVENYFAMQRDQGQIPRDRAAGRVATYKSVHLGADGFRTDLSAADRLAEVARELPLHEPLIQQMRAALPRPESSLLLLRASEVMQTPGAAFAPVPRELEMAPVRPLLEVRFPGL